MSDYLIDKYNAKIAAALKAKEHAVGQATQLWHRACEDIVAEWQAQASAASIELTIALEHRNRVYIDGPAPGEPKRLEHRPSEESPPSEQPAAAINGHSP